MAAQVYRLTLSWEAAPSLLLQYVPSQEYSG